jgi:hypothetical protein
LNPVAVEIAGRSTSSGARAERLRFTPFCNRGSQIVRMDFAQPAPISPVSSSFW